MAFLYDDGKRIYDLLQEALQNRGRLFKSQQEQSTTAMTTPALDAVELLSKLKLMFEQDWEKRGKNLGKILLSLKVRVLE